MDYFYFPHLKATAGQGKKLQLMQRRVWRSVSKGNITPSPCSCPQLQLQNHGLGMCLWKPAVLDIESLLVVLLKNRSTKGQQRSERLEMRTCHQNTLQVELALPRLLVLKTRWKNLLPSKIILCCSGGVCEQRNRSRFHKVLDLPHCAKGLSWKMPVHDGCGPTAPPRTREEVCIGEYRAAWSRRGLKKKWAHGGRLRISWMSGALAHGGKCRLILFLF